MKCNICERQCVVKNGQKGACGRYINKDNTISEVYPNKYLLTCPISVETMPMMNFAPRGKFLQISTTGCNFDCPGCIAMVVAKQMDSNSEALKELTPEDIINKAKKEDCIGIVFLMNDPLASFNTFLEIGKLAKKNGLFLGCSSNAYFTEDSLEKISKYLDFINVGLKGLSDAAYKSCAAKTYKVVIRNIKKFHEKGVHVEVACIHKKNDDNNVLDIANLISKISKNIPLQIMRFIPFGDSDIKDEPSIEESKKVYNKTLKILNYTYLFNSPGQECLNTYCPECKEIIFKRDFYGPMGSKLRNINIALDKTCPKCGNKIIFKENISEKIYSEKDFQGGYPFTRALEIIEGTLATIGVKDKKNIVKAWEDILINNSGLKKLHDNIHSFKPYAEKILYLGKITNKEEKAKELISYMQEKINFINIGIKKINKKEKVLYVMGGPLFVLGHERLENKLVEMAGGISINVNLEINGRPGKKLEVEEINKLNPDVIFLSSFMANNKKDFLNLCGELNINAVKNKKIFNHYAPCFDFGSPRWILGLMYIANSLYPKIFKFNILQESKYFYKKFYNVEFKISDINRSFARPVKYWEVN